MKALKNALCIYLSIAMALMGSGCGSQGGAPATGEAPEDPAVEVQAESATADSDLSQLSVFDLPVVETDGIEYSQLSDPELQRYLEDAVYTQLIEELDSSEYVVEDVEATYISKEYVDELAYNSQANVYFGFTLEELESYYQGEKYVFTLGEDGHTITRAFEGYDDTYAQVVKNVAMGGGVILLCVTISAVSGGVGAPAASMVFAMAAKSGTIVALSSGAISFISAAVLTGIETGDVEQALDAGVLQASESFKWGAIGGALTGGASKAYGLYQATAGGLTMNQVATIQRESRLPLDVIRQLNNMDQYEILKEAGCYARMVNGQTALVRDIDLTRLDEMGRTNLQRMQQGLAPLDPQGVAYELHHVGQRTDSMLAILTQEEHRLGDSYGIWHHLVESGVDHGTSWATQKSAFWKAMGEALAALA